MERCFLDFIFVLGAARIFVFLMGEGLFYPIDETRFS